MLQVVLVIFYLDGTLGENLVDNCIMICNHILLVEDPKSDHRPNRIETTNIHRSSGHIVDVPLYIDIVALVF